MCYLPEVEGHCLSSTFSILPMGKAKTGLQDFRGQALVQSNMGMRYMLHRRLKLGYRYTYADITLARDLEVC
jgi:hypothetical protein